MLTRNLVMSLMASFWLNSNRISSIYKPARGCESSGGFCALALYAFARVQMTDVQSQEMYQDWMEMDAPFIIVL